MNMKTIKLKSSMLAGLCALCLLLAGWVQGGIKDIVKPYVGEYECKQATLGGMDCLDEFDYIKLELQRNGKFTLRFCEKSGKKNTIEGTYEYDDKTKSIIFKLDSALGGQRKFPVKDGILYITVPFGVCTLSMQFLQK